VLTPPIVAERFQIGERGMERLDEAQASLARLGADLEGLLSSAPAPSLTRGQPRFAPARARLHG
jgi:hypothetical protein